MTRLALTLALLATAPLAAQNRTVQTIPVNVGDGSAWNVAPAQHDRIWVVTNTNPGVRQSCKKPIVTESTLTCKRHFHKVATYSRADVAALLAPPTSDRALLFTMGGWLALGGGTIYGGVLLAGVALAGGIPIIVLGGLIVLVTPVIALGADGDTPEVLLYQQPSTPLTVTVGH